MDPTTTIPRPRSREMGTALLIYAVTVGISMWIGAQKPVTLSSVLVSSAVVAAGTLAMGFYLVRWTPYSRRSFLTAATVMAGSALIGPLVMSDPVAWAESVRPMLWMNPWLLMTMATASPRSGGRVCAPTAPWAGTLLVGVAVLLTLISWGAAWLSQRH